MKTALNFVVLLVALQYVLSDSTVDRNELLKRVEADPHLEAYLREAIENFREQMKQGIDAINMPVLDPLQLKRLDINVYENLATMDLKIKTLTVRSLSVFNLTHLKPNLEEMYLGINMTLPELYVNGQYSVSGTLLKIFPIYGDGNFDINATDINISGVGQLGFTAETIQMSLLRLDLTWQHLSVNMENFLGGGSFSNVLQRVVPDVGRDIFHVYKPLIMEKLETSLTRKVNDKLKEECVKDIIKAIIPKQ